MKMKTGCSDLQIVLTPDLFESLKSSRNTIWAASFKDWGKVENCPVSDQMNFEVLYGNHRRCIPQAKTITLSSFLSVHKTVSMMVLGFISAHTVYCCFVSGEKKRGNVSYFLCVEVTTIRAEVQGIAFPKIF